MPDTAPGPARAAALGLAHLDGVLTPAEAAELSALLIADPVAADAFVGVCLRDGLLAESFRDTYRLAPTRPAPAPARRRRPVRARAVRRRWPLALAAALLWAVGVGYFGFRPDPADEPAEAPGPARLVRAIGCRWDDPQPRAGDLRPGDRFRLAEGVAEFRFAAGVRVTATAGTDLTVGDGGVVRLDGGTLTADVPPAGVGFRVETPAGTVTDLGTWFRVRVEKDGAAAVEVFEGAVAVAPAGGGEPTRVPAPESVRFTRAGASPNGVAARPDARRLFPGVLATERVRPGVPPAGPVTPGTYPPRAVTVVQERTDHALARDLRAVPFRAGEFLSAPPAEAAVPRGKRVHSYLVNLGAGAAEGKVEFASRVLAVVRTGAGLAASDEELTAAKFAWPADGRGLDGLTADDTTSLWLNPNRKSLWVRRTAAAASQFRVLLEAEE